MLFELPEMLLMIYYLNGEKGMRPTVNDEQPRKGARPYHKRINNRGVEQLSTAADMHF